MAITSTPEATGAGLVVATSAALALLSADGLTIGTRVWNIETGSYWRLATSTASTSSTVVAVLGTTGARWLASQGTLSVTGLTVAGDITTTGDVTIGDDLVVTDDAHITGTLTVTEAVNADDINAGGDLDVTGFAEVHGVLIVVGELQGTTGAFTGKVLTADSLLQGANLGDADATITVAANEYTMPQSTMTVNRTVTLGVTGSPVTGEIIRIYRRDTTNKTLAIVNGGGGAGTLLTFAASLKAVATFTYGGADWALTSYAKGRP